MNFQSILLYLKLLAGRGTNGGWVDGRTDGSVGKSLEHATLAAKVTTTTTSFQTAPPHSYNKGGPWLFWMANAKATLILSMEKKFHTYICRVQHRSGYKRSPFLVWTFSRCFSIYCAITDANFTIYNL